MLTLIRHIWNCNGILYIYKWIFNSHIISLLYKWILLAIKAGGMTVQWVHTAARTLSERETEKASEFNVSKKKLVNSFTVFQIDRLTGVSLFCVYRRKPAGQNRCQFTCIFDRTLKNLVVHAINYEPLQPHRIEFFLYRYIVHSIAKSFQMWKWPHKTATQYFAHVSMR